MMDKQVESCILNISCDRLGEIMFSPKLDNTKIWPCSVKSQTLVKGMMQTVGCVMKVEFMDGSMCEAEVTYCDPTKFKLAYKILKSTKPCYQMDCEIQVTMRMRPVTFCGCPFLQAIQDKEVCKMGCPMKDMGVKASQKTFMEWRTKFSKPIPAEMMEMVRSDKLTMLSDMMKDMSGEQALMNCKRRMTDMDMFVAKKIGNVETPKMTASQCPMGGLYTFEMAKKDAMRYGGPDMKTSTNSP